MCIAWDHIYQKEIWCWIAAFYKNVMFLHLAFQKLPQSVQQKVERYRMIVLKKWEKKSLTGFSLRILAAGERCNFTEEYFERGSTSE